MGWLYNNELFTDSGNSFGFVYLITHLSTNKKYIGKKFFTKSSSYQKNKRRRKRRVASDWQTYYGSNKILQSDVQKLGAENFKREILYLCKNKAECGYRELVEIIERKALEREDYYNDWVSCKITRKHIDSFKK